VNLEGRKKEEGQQCRRKFGKITKRLKGKVIDGKRKKKTLSFLAINVMF
jgi:hypothetical protein